MTQELTPVLPKISTLQHRFLQLYAETPLLQYCSDKLNTPLETLRGWLSKKKVQVNLQHYQAKIAEKCPYTLEQVAMEAARVAFYDPKQHIEAINSENGEFLIKYKDLDKIDGRAIKNIREKIVDGVSMVVIEPYEKDKFLRILADILKNQTEQHLHVHLTPEDLAKRDINGAADAYRELMGN